MVSRLAVENFSSVSGILVRYLVSGYLNWPMAPSVAFEYLSFELVAA